jgi:hypothetical protein
MMGFMHAEVKLVGVETSLRLLKWGRFLLLYWHELSMLGGRKWAHLHRSQSWR